MIPQGGGNSPAIDWSSRINGSCVGSSYGDINKCWGYETLTLINDSAVFFYTNDASYNYNTWENVRAYLTVNGQSIDMDSFFINQNCSTGGDGGETSCYSNYTGYVYAKKGDVIHLYGHYLNLNALYARKLR